MRFCTSAQELAAHPWSRRRITICDGNIRGRICGADGTWWEFVAQCVVLSFLSKPCHQFDNECVNSGQVVHNAFDIVGRCKGEFHLFLLIVY